MRKILKVAAAVSPLSFLQDAAPTTHENAPGDGKGRKL